MEKTVYSLVLADEVVFAIDNVAARKGTSRSNLVNHILAEYVNLVTPEVRNTRVLDSLGSAATVRGMRIDARSTGALTVKTALCYKYNPALAYTIEMQSTDDFFGCLRLTLRSQNQVVLAYFANFLDLWNQLEHEYLPQPPPNSAHTMEEKKYSRSFRRLDLEEEAVGKAVASYVSLLDDCMKTFFQNVDQMEDAIHMTQQHYSKNLDENTDMTLL